MMMDDGIEMQTMFGDCSQQQDNSILGKLFSAGKRLLVGEILFQPQRYPRNGKKFCSLDVIPGSPTKLDFLFHKNSEETVRIVANSSIKFRHGQTFPHIHYDSSEN